MKTLVYDCMRAHYEGEHRKPREIFYELGINVLSWEAEPIFDRIIVKTDSLCEKLPIYIQEER